MATYHWSSAKIAHMREGAVAAERPKLGRPSTALSSKSSTVSKNFNENPSVKSHTSSHGDAAGSTDGKNVNTDGRPIRTRDSKQGTSRPIKSRSVVVDSQDVNNNGQPITARTVEPAKIQTRVVDPDSGRLVHPDYVKKGPLITTKAFQNWTPDLLGLPSDSRPVRSTRNKNPSYVDAIWSASQEEIDALNQSISRKPTK